MQAIEGYFYGQASGGGEGCKEVGSCCMEKARMHDLGSYYAAGLGQKSLLGYSGGQWETN